MRRVGDHELHGDVGGHDAANDERRVGRFLLNQRSWQDGRGDAASSQLLQCLNCIHLDDDVQLRSLALSRSIQLAS